MSDHLKNFLAKVSADDQLVERLKSAAEYEDVLALAKELGCELSMQDIDPTPNAEMNDSELDAISGGKTTGRCFCALAGGGGGKQDGETYGCACVGYGQGGNGEWDSFICWCTGAGNGNNNIDDGDTVY